MTVPQEYHGGETETLMILVRIISRRSWDDLQAMHLACPGSHIEHLHAGLYILFVPPGGATKAVA